MGAYFKSWRRKIGVVTLLFACVLAAIWARSMVVKDIFLAHSKGYVHSSGEIKEIWFVTSTDGCFRLITWSSPRGLTADLVGFHAAVPRGTATVSDTFSAECRFRFCGLEFRQSPIRKSPDATVTVYILPYALFLLPQVLLSTYLLFANPRKRENSAQPAPAE